MRLYIIYFVICSIKASKKVQKRENVIIHINYDFVHRKSFRLYNLFNEFSKDTVTVNIEHFIGNNKTIQTEMKIF